MLEPIDTEQYLRGLNPRQHEAVIHDPGVPLQILAGPGSGKTRVVASRIAHLIDEHGIAPKDIVSVTFTNKAAAEMKTRLERFIGPERTEKLVLGTFHSVCVRYLRPYHALVGLPAKFVIQDQDDCLKQIKALMQPELSRITKAGEGRIKRPEGWVQGQISKAKAKNQTPEDLRTIAASSATGSDADELPLIVADIYERYEEGLANAEAVDFDDLLLRALQLFQEHGDRVLANIQHVFIDEFQDTNTIQYLLAKHLAGARQTITIVGDPDQSIYGWRSAEVKNLATMREDFDGARQILLEENYRSTAGILNYGTAIINQDAERIQKKLISMRGAWSTPYQREFSDRENEVSFVAKEIKRVKHGFGLSWSDICILLRYNADSRMLETALAKEGIPSRVLNGRKFFQRAEVMIITGYLQLLENENFLPAFERIINIPARRVGAVALKSITEVVQTTKKSPIAVLRGSKIPFSEGSLAFKACRKFVDVYDELRGKAEAGASVTSLIETLLERVDIQGHLERTEPDYASKWQNVLEMQTFAASTERNLETVIAKEKEDRARGEASELAIPLADLTPLQRFLQQTALVSDVSEENDDSDGSTVLMSTVHQAKGLEWPVVFVPSLVEGTIPSFMADTPEQVAEERRLFYVAATRAEAFLYVTHYQAKAGFDGKPKECKASPFLPDPKSKLADGRTVSVARPPKADEASRLALHSFLGRPPPDESSVLAAMEKHLATGAEQPADGWYGISVAQALAAKRKAEWSGKSYWSTRDDEYALPPMMASQQEPGGFARASQLVKITNEAKSTKSGPRPAGFVSAAELIKNSSPKAAADSDSYQPLASTSRVPTSPTPSAKGPPPLKIASSMRRGPVPVSYKRAPRAPPTIPKADPPTKWAPKRLPDADRFTLPPMDAYTSRSADPSIIAKEQPSLNSFATLANDSMSAWKSIGLPPATAGPSTAAPAAAAPSRAARPVLNAQAAPWVPPSATLSSTVSSTEPATAEPPRKRSLGMTTRPRKAPALKKPRK